MKRSPLLIAALPLFTACSAAQLEQGLRDFNALAAATSTPASAAQGVSAASPGATTVRPGSEVPLGKIIYGDVKQSRPDRYFLRGEEGEEYLLFMQDLAGNIYGGPGLQLKNTTENALLAALGDSYGGEVYSPAITLPETGLYPIEIVAGGPESEGRYRFSVRRLNRAPEVVPAALTLGTTVTGEGIEIPYDIDTFSFEGQKGQNVVLDFQFLNGNMLQSARATLTHQATGRYIVTSGSNGTKVTLQTESPAPVTLPETGTYRVEVSGDVGPYRFRLRPAQ